MWTLAASTVPFTEMDATQRLNADDATHVEALLTDNLWQMQATPIADIIYIIEDGVKGEFAYKYAAESVRDKNALKAYCRRPEGGVVDTHKPEDCLAKNGVYFSVERNERIA